VSVRNLPSQLLRDARPATPVVVRLDDAAALTPPSRPGVRGPLLHAAGHPDLRVGSMTVGLTAGALTRVAHAALESGSASSATIPALLPPAREHARTFDLRLVGQLVSFGRDRQIIRPEWRRRSPIVRTRPSPCGCCGGICSDRALIRLFDCAHRARVLLVDVGDAQTVDADGSVYVRNRTHLHRVGVNALRRVSAALGARFKALRRPLTISPRSSRAQRPRFRVVVPQ